MKNEMHENLLISVQSLKSLIQNEAYDSAKKQLKQIESFLNDQVDSKKGGDKNLEINVIDWAKNLDKHQIISKRLYNIIRSKPTGDDWNNKKLKVAYPAEIITFRHAGPGSIKEFELLKESTRKGIYKEILDRKIK